MQQLTLDILPAPEPSLDNFVAGPNAEALAIAEELAAGRFPARTVMYWGPPGCGKSHLLSAVATAQPAHQWLDPGQPASMEPPAGPAVLLAEELPAWGDASLQQFFLLLNLLRPRDDVTVLVTAAQPPAGLNLRDDLRTRLASGLVIGMQLLSDADKHLALQVWANARGHKDIEAVSQWLLLHRDRDIRSLMAYLDALDRFALQTRRPLTTRLLHEFERNRLPDQGP